MLRGMQVVLVFEGGSAEQGQAGKTGKQKRQFTPKPSNTHSIAPAMQMVSNEWMMNE
jgi:hypothetical protein